MLPLLWGRIHPRTVRWLLEKGGNACPGAEEVVCVPVEDVTQVAWTCWPIAVRLTSVIAYPTIYPSMVVTPEEGTLGGSIVENIDSGARLPPYNLGLVS